MSDASGAGSGPVDPWRSPESPTPPPSAPHEPPPPPPPPPGYEAPGYQAPTYGAPSYGAPSYGAPSYGATAYGSPAGDDQQTRAFGYEPPPAGAVPPDQPSPSPQPGYQQPTYQQPTYQQPAHQQPAFEQPAFEQSGYQQPGYGPPAYGPQAAHGQPPGYAQPPGYGPPMGVAAPYGAGYGYAPQRVGPSGSAIALTIVSGLLTLSCYFTIAGLPALVLAIVGLVKNDRDPAAANQLVKIGWIVLGAVSAVIVIGFIVLVVWLGVTAASDPLTGSSDTY